jgi:hypothetical protein
MRGVRNVRRALVVLAIAFVIIGADAAAAAPGDVDATFSSNVKQTVGRSGFNFEAQAMAVEPGGGAILLAGLRRDEATQQKDFAIVRLRPGGGQDDVRGCGG